MKILAYFTKTRCRVGYTIPDSYRMDDLVEHREHSDCFQCLNGKWRFRFYTSIYDLQDNFFETDFCSERYDTISVPGGVAELRI